MESYEILRDFITFATVISLALILVTAFRSWNATRHERKMHEAGFRQRAIKAIGYDSENDREYEYTELVWYQPSHEQEPQNG
jgi:hypothetical protein